MLRNSKNYQTGAEIDDMEIYRNFAKKAANELQYSLKVVNDIEKAKSIGEIQRIMVTARKNHFND